MKSSWFWKESDGAKRPTPALQWGLVLLSALLLWAGWPSGGWPGLLFVAFTPLLALVEYMQAGQYTNTGRKLGWRIYSALLLWNILTTGWVHHATLPGALAMVSINALLMLIPWLLYMRLRTRIPRIAMFVGLLAWLTLEYQHFHWEMAWPWLNLGFGFANVPGWVQWYEYTGVLGGTLWILVANAAFYMVFWRHGAILHGQIRWLSLTYTLLGVIGIPLLISTIRAARFQAEGTPVEAIVVQPNQDPYSRTLISQPHLSTGPARLAHWLALSDSLITPNTRWLLWPESALPGFIWEHDENHPVLRQLAAWQADYPQLQLVVGATTGTVLDSSQHVRPYTRFSQSGSAYEVHNSAIWFAQGHSGEYYHKSVLVPGVEVLPFAQVLQPILGPVFRIFGGTNTGFAPQDTAEVFATSEGLVVAPAVCYESIFGEHVAQQVQLGAQAIALITNDAWWADTQGYRQHFAYARLLAISLRRPVMRSANTGISGFIHADGSVTQQTAFYTEAARRDTVLFSDTLTPYARHGDSLGRLACGLLVFLLGSAAVKGFIQRKETKHE